MQTSQGLHPPWIWSIFTFMFISQQSSKLICCGRYDANKQALFDPDQKRMRVPPKKTEEINPKIPFMNLAGGTVQVHVLMIEWLKAYAVAGSRLWTTFNSREQQLFILFYSCNLLHATITMHDSHQTVDCGWWNTQKSIHVCFHCRLLKL